ncbi:hypothetical protein [Marinomonas algarum]|uniref:Uncharacterized protein n=1 Tax=Marinomonas algarum TaxID=2883105 RepID=A0A9X1ILT3_9GAMM|nr:hypothetical protein [Marinomonas algarum]MCB5161267.1 hypothetical protein [Marinomonas algarum]
MILRTSDSVIVYHGANYWLPGGHIDGLREDYLASMASSIPLKCLGAVEDIANTALFFLSAWKNRYEKSPLPVTSYCTSLIQVPTVNHDHSQKSVC